MRNNLTLRIRDLAKVGVLLDQVVTLGANSISGPTFTVDDPTPLRGRGAPRGDRRCAPQEQALCRGRRTSRSGRSFASRKATCSRRSRSRAGVMMRMEAAADTSVPIEGGELTFQAQVTVSWRLAD